MLAPNVTIYFIRHGETDWNAATRMQGQRDIPLNETGRAQAARNGCVLRDSITNPNRYDYVASPLIRARETMEIARRELGLPAAEYRTDPILKEIHFGEWEGFTWEELRAKAPEAIEARFDDPWNCISPGGESYAMLSERTEKWLKSVTCNTVVVSHGGVSRCLRGLLLSLGHDEIPQLPVPQGQLLHINGNGLEWI